MITDVLFDFFGTPVTYSGSRVAQGFEQSHALVRRGGAVIGYLEFLDRWETTWQVHEATAQRELDEYSMDDVCTAFLERVMGRTPSRDRRRAGSELEAQLLLQG